MRGHILWEAAFAVSRGKLLISRHLYPPFVDGEFSGAARESVSVFYGPSSYLHTSLRCRTICVTLV